MDPRTYVDVHILQTVPPSCINRDDAGTPKQAIYGGVRRARVSSQAWKRATRVTFTDRLELPQEQLGVRTKRVAALLAGRLAALAGLDEPEALRLGIAVKDAIIGAGKPKASNARGRAGKGKPDAAVDDGGGQEETTVPAGSEDASGKQSPADSPALLFFGFSQLDAMAALVASRARDLAALPDGKLLTALEGLQLREMLRNGHPIDVGLFGRFVADLSMLGVDASCQVAHSIATGASEFEFDYYTAVDEGKDRSTDDAGAGHLGTTEYTSATLYRYATVAVHQLLKNLDGDPEAAAAALAAFLKAFTFSMPTGHQNSFAHRTLPSLLSVVVRGDQPVNLVSAFEAPVRANGQGVTGPSVRRFVAELQRASTAWGLVPLLTASQYDPGPGGADPELAAVLGDPRPFSEIIEAVSAAVRPRMPQLVAQ
jgi:CRISPR system Cascade subunit CasC